MVRLFSFIFSRPALLTSFKNQTNEAGQANLTLDEWHVKQSRSIKDDDNDNDNDCDYDYDYDHD